MATTAERLQAVEDAIDAWVSTEGLDRVQVGGRGASYNIEQLEKLRDRLQKQLNSEQLASGKNPPILRYNGRYGQPR